QEQVARKRRIAALENDDSPEEELEDLRDLLSHKESAKKAKPGPNGFERLIAQESRDRRNGNDGAAVERVLESINRSKRNSADIPDPALISDIELSPVAENTDLDKLGVGVIDGLTSGIGRILEDAKKAEREEGRRVSRRSARLAGWQGFWESVDPCMSGSLEKIVLKVVGDHPILSMLRIGADEGGTLAIMLASGLLEPVLRESPENVISLADYLLSTALTSIQTDSTTAACESLLTLIDIAPSYAFTDSPNLLLTVQVIWQGLGARSTYVPHPRSLQQIRRVPVSSDRETASGLICSIIKRSAENKWVASSEARILAHMLLLLAVDPGTSTALRRCIDRTLIVIWPLCLSQTTTVEFAISLCALANPLPLPARCQMLLAVGQWSEEARDISRWMATELLVPGTLNSLSQDCVHVVPNIDVLTQGAQAIYEVLMTNAPDHEAVSDLLTLLSEAMSDTSAVIEVTLTLSDFEIFRDVLRRSMKRIQTRLSDSLEGENQARLSQLDMAIRMQLDVGKKRREKAQRQTMKSIIKGEGRDDQTKLCFGQVERE
ncbi:MAG: hypothetical protein TREMPRED_005470, partial [Tremellales sp. Tagirdzhanova-0007]